MIKNEKQYKISKSQLANLEAALEKGKHASHINVHPLLHKAQVDAIQSQKNELKEEIFAYEVLRSGEVSLLELDSFDLLPIGLIKARIARGLSQKDLAERMGLKEQQIQKYESTDYSSASFERVKQVVNALDLKVSEKIFLKGVADDFKLLFKNLANLGIPKELLLNKVLPVNLASKIRDVEHFAEVEANNIFATMSSIVQKVFSVDLTSVMKGSLTRINVSALSPVKYKKSLSANDQKVSAYTVYAHMLALNVVGCIRKKEQIPVSDDPDVVRGEILANYGSITFQNVVRYIWSKGIPVIALDDPGAFHGACWRIDGFNVIVLKQHTMSEARWIVDALHELYHTTQHPDNVDFAVIEAGDVSSADGLIDEEEEEATYYAVQVFLSDKVDDLTHECIKRAGGNLANLKNEVLRVASENSVSIAGLANYLAYLLAREQNRNWWGVANNLQPLGFSPWEVCRSELFRNCDFEKLNSFDRDLLIRAIM